MKLANKVAIVTGAGGGGTGRAVARRMAREGAAVVVCDVNTAGGQETVRLIESDGGRATFVRGDVGVENEVQALVAAAEAAYGGLDVLVNDASAPYPPQGLLAGWFDAVQVDLLGTMYAIWHAVPAMRRRGGGAIVNIGSTSAIGHGYKHSNSPAYDVAKMAVIRLTTTLAPLAEKESIRVNCLVPDWVASPEVQEYYDSLTLQQRVAQGVPPVLTTLDEAADAIVQLATDETLAGRVMIWWNGHPRQFVPRGDRGYATLE